MSGVKERLIDFLEYEGISKSEFGRRIGVSNAFVTSMRKSIQPDKILAIQKQFPNLNTNWLMTGEGEMLKSDRPKNEVEPLNLQELDKLKDALKSNAVTYIPLVNIDSVGGIHSNNLIDSSEQYIQGMVPFPDARTGDLAIFQSGNSMTPVIPAGAIMQIRRVETWREYFGYGSDCVLWLSDNRRITKQILRYDPDPKNYVLCHSYNPEAGDEELPKSMIKEVWKVINVLINKGW